MTLDEIINIARQAEAAFCKEGEDPRPAWLRALTDADHPTCPYYLFLHLLSNTWMAPEAPVILEIGSYVGVSALHMATGARWLVSLDSDPNAKRLLDEHGLEHVRAITASSIPMPFELLIATMGTVAVATGTPVFDWIFFDGNHDPRYVYHEYWAYRPMVKPGGLMIFDDRITIGDAWTLVRDPKVELDFLHPNVGFGIAMKGGW